jgi:hypothetical protein
MTPPNTLKLKAGAGGLDEKIIAKAQEMIDKAEIDFLPLGQRYLTALQEGMRMTEQRRGQVEDEALITTMLYPAMQLKANGGMFGYPLVTAIAARLIRFLEHIHDPNPDAMDIVNGFANALQAIMLMGEKSKDGSENGNQLAEVLDEACTRYFEKHPG